MADEKLVLAVVRGDDELDEAKLQTATGAAAGPPRPPRGDPRRCSAPTPARWARWASRNAPVFVDETLAGAAGMVTGANENDVHLEGVDVKRDIAAGRSSPTCAR